MQNYRSQSATTTRRISIDDAHRQASGQPRVVITTTKIATAKQSGKVCGVFATITEGPLSGFSGLIYIGDVARNQSQTAEQLCNAMVNPVGQRFSAQIKEASIERGTGAPRLKVGFWKLTDVQVAPASAPAETSDTHTPAAVAPATIATVQTASAAASQSVGTPFISEHVTVTVFLNAEIGGFHCCKVTKDGTEEIVNERDGIATLEGSLNAAQELAQEHKVQEVVVVDPKRRLLTTNELTRLRVSQIRMWASTAKRKDAAGK